MPRVEASWKPEDALQHEKDKIREYQQKTSADTSDDQVRMEVQAKDLDKGIEELSGEFECLVCDLSISRYSGGSLTVVLPMARIPRIVKKSTESINNKLALVMKSGKYTLGYKTILRTLRSSKVITKKIIKSGAVTTLGRGASDLTTTTIGKALGLRETQVWKDIDGVLTCDPNIYTNAKPVPYLTFEEAAGSSAAGVFKIIRPAIGEAVREMPLAELKNKYRKVSSIKKASKGWQDEYEVSSKQVLDDSSTRYNKVAQNAGYCSSFSYTSA
uniref:Aspartate/glutamate/uridylate kinase domain-containing protein n=1 Tax=Ananas comosus var. bracteatus TaxID=296719 RepID=A0A6V7P9I8_ANACO|nr:unnamed protein product [Ananas comosus var. bracteatus]